MFLNLLLAKLVWMPSVFYNPNCYLQSCAYFYFVPFSLHRIGNLLAYVTAFLWLAFVDSVAFVDDR